MRGKINISHQGRAHKNELFNCAAVMITTNTGFHRLSLICKSLTLE